MKKKYSLLTAIMVAFAVLVVLSWIIPSSSYYYGTFTKGTVTPFGLADLFKVPLWTASTIFQFSLIFLTIGGFYGVVNKTGAYSKLLEGIKTKFKKKPHVFLISSVIAFALLSSVMGGSFALFILVPFAISALLILGYGKCAAVLATVGAMLAGTIGSTFAFDVNGYINYYLSQNVEAGVVYKVILLVLTVTLLIFFTLKLAKKEDKVTDIPLYEEEKDSKKGYLPIVILTIVGVLVCLAGAFSWNDMYGIKFFNELHTSITSFKVFGYPLFDNLLGNMTQFGSWSNQDFNAMIIVMSLVIGLVYKLKFKEILNSFLKGAKEMVPTFVYATLANIIIVTLMNSSSGQAISYTIMNFLFTLGSGFNALAYGLAVFVDSFFVNYFPYLSSDILQSATTTYTSATVYPVMGVITQAIYGLSMYILPTSLLLVAALAYLNISFKEWFKYIWRYLLYLLAVIVVVILVALMFV